MLISNDALGLFQINLDRDQDEEKEQASFGYSVVWLFSALIVLLYILKSNDLFLASLILGIPFVLFLFLAFHGMLSSHLIVIDHHQNIVKTKDRWLFRWKQKTRNYKELSATLIVEDKVHLPTLGMRPRFRLFFCLGQKTNRRRVLLIGDIDSSQEAARVAQEIGKYTGWPIEFLTLDRTISETDIDWESW